jgi:hypothetical protein
MPELTNELLAIKGYILDPDKQGAHLLEMAETMADDAVRDAKVPLDDRQEARDAALGKSAETIAGFIHLAWGGAGVDKYAHRSYELLCALRDRMRGMDPEATWRYAIDALNVDIHGRLRRAKNLTLDPAKERAMLEHFFDKVKEYDYLHDLVQEVMQLHWHRRHRLESSAARDTDKKNVPFGPRGDEVMETHLHRAATEAVATYIEQVNITRGMIENLTDTAIVLRDRVNIQKRLGAVDEQTWAESARVLADTIESRFGTRAGCKEAHLARGRWRTLARQHRGSRKPK